MPGTRFDREQQTQVVIDSTPIVRTVLDGPVGAFHSIVVQDLHSVDDKPEVYAATSPGRQPKRRGCLHPDHGQRPDERCRRKHCIGS